MKMYGLLQESARNLDLETNGLDGSHCFNKESHRNLRPRGQWLRSHGFNKESDRNLDLETNGSHFKVLVRNSIGI